MDVFAVLALVFAAVAVLFLGIMMGMVLAGAVAQREDAALPPPPPADPRQALLDAVQRATDTGASSVVRIENGVATDLGHTDARDQTRSGVVVVDDRDQAPPDGIAHSRLRYHSVVMSAAEIDARVRVHQAYLAALRYAAAAAVPVVPVVPASDANVSVTLARAEFPGYVDKSHAEPE